MRAIRLALLELAFGAEWFICAPSAMGLIQVLMPKESPWPTGAAQDPARGAENAQNWTI